MNFANAALSTVAAMAAMKPNQSRGSLLPTTNNATTTDISRMIIPNATIVSHLLPQADPVALSALYSSHAPAINRIFQQDSISSSRRRSRDRGRERHRSPPSSHGSSLGHRSDSDYRRHCRHEYRDVEESYRYRSRLGGGNAKDGSLVLTVMFFCLFVSLSGFLSLRCEVNPLKNMNNPTDILCLSVLQ